MRSKSSKTSTPPRMALKILLWDQLDNTVTIKRILSKYFTLIITGQLCVVNFKQGIYVTYFSNCPKNWNGIIVFKIFKYKLGSSVSRLGQQFRRETTAFNDQSKLKITPIAYEIWIVYEAPPPSSFHYNPLQLSSWKYLRCNWNLCIFVWGTSS